MYPVVLYFLFIFLHKETVRKLHKKTSRNSFAVWNNKIIILKKTPKNREAYKYLHTTHQESKSGCNSFQVGYGDGDASGDASGVMVEYHALEKNCNE